MESKKRTESMQDIYLALKSSRESNPKRFYRIRMEVYIQELKNSLSRGNIENANLLRNLAYDYSCLHNIVLTKEESDLIF